MGLAKNDPSVVEEVVSKDFRDPRRGVSGKAGMGRIVADLWATYPDLEVSVVGQEAEGDVVRTRLVLSGTDRGSGVMWYPPTGRWVSFEAEFADRFKRACWSSTRGGWTPRGSYANWGTTERADSRQSVPNFREFASPNSGE